MFLIVSVLLICLRAMCALSDTELEDFSDFLEKTSVLDHGLKVSNEFGGNWDSPESDDVSEQAWEQSGKFEGDLILNDRQRRLVVANVVEGLSRNGLRDITKRWPSNEVVYYIQREHFSGSQMQAIQAGIEDISQISCVTFRPYKKGDRDAVVIQGNRGGCFSQVGYQGGYQVLNLSRRHPAGRGCFRHGTVVHELLHTLGFFHMQSSHDRDDYIDVIWENIIETSKHNFRKYNTFTVSDFGVGYDYDSVMHYSAKAFSNNGRPTILPKQRGASIGQRVGLSDKDAEKLKKMYCDAENNADSALKSPAPTASPAFPADAADAPEYGPRPRSVHRKMVASNQPFQGHGIGYHQGKTVVIKLPAAKTYNLPVIPSIRTFDYFSKTPKALLPKFVPRFGIGKEIKFKRPPPFSFNKKLDDVETMFLKELNKEDNEPETTTPNPKTAPAPLGAVDDKQKSKELLPSDLPSDLTEAFIRLGEIIKSHVYPSQRSKVGNSKGETDFSEFLRMGSKEKIIKQNVDIAEKGMEKVNTEMPLNKTNDGTTMYPDDDDISKYGETDESYGTTSSFKELIRQNQFPYSDLDHSFKYDYKDTEDFNDMYDGKHTNDRKIGEPYKLFGELVPLSVSENSEEGHLKMSNPIIKHSYGVQQRDDHSSEKLSHKIVGEDHTAKSHKPYTKINKTGPWMNINKTRASIYYEDTSHEYGDFMEYMNPKGREFIQVYPTDENSHVHTKHKNNYRENEKSKKTENMKFSSPMTSVQETRGSSYHEDGHETDDAADYHDKYDDYQVPAYPPPTYLKDHDPYDENSGFNYNSDDVMNPSISSMSKEPSVSSNSPSDIISETDSEKSKHVNKDRQQFSDLSNTKDGDYSTEYEGSFEKRLSEILKEFKYNEDSTEHYTPYKY